MAVELTAEQKAAAAKAKGSTAKKVLWWILGILGLILVVVFILVIVLRKGPIRAAEDIVKKTRHEIDKADIEAKIKAAAAAGAEKEAVEGIKKIMEIDDGDKRRERLAELLGA
jgi:hypothetical protein